jgi:molecular chaperone HscB
MWRVVSGVNLQSDDFELLGLKRLFHQDLPQLDARKQDLQRLAHPDQFANQGAAAQRVAMQWSVRINEACQRLKDPLKRAAYLCELHGVPVHADKNTAMPADFLMQQMQWREDLNAAHSADDLEQICRQVNHVKREMLQKIEHWMDEQQNFDQAVGIVRALMFVERFAADVDQRIDQLDE